MRRLFPLYVMTFSLLFPSCTNPNKSTSAAAPLRVLFIGNSLTYTNNLPGMLEQMSAHEIPPLHCEAVTFPGVSLAFHRGTGFAERKLKSHAWDFVVLQEYSTRPLERPDATTASVRFFLKFITAAGAQPILFENWSRPDRPGSYPLLRERFEQISRDTAVPLARVGDAWQLARNRFPWFKPLIDERHPAPIGTYLAACVLFKSIYQHEPTDAPVPRGILPTQSIALQEIPRALPSPAPQPTTTTSR